MVEGDDAGVEAQTLLTERLAAIREWFTRALTSTEDDLLTVLEVELRVDQVREIVAARSVPMYWEERDGRRALTARDIPARLFLGAVVGDKRWMAADTALTLLAELCRDQPRYAVVETDASMLVNLFVVEPFHTPELASAIWLTLAHNLATGDVEADLFSRLPATRTAYDPLHAQIPPGTPYGDHLRPPAVPEQTVEQYRATLLASLGGAEPERYVRTHVFERVAAQLRCQKPAGTV